MRRNGGNQAKGEKWWGTLTSKEKEETEMSGLERQLPEQRYRNMTKDKSVGVRVREKQEV